MLKTRKKELFINLLILGFVIIILFSLFEISLRILEPKPKYSSYRQNEFVFYEYDDTLGWVNKPNASGVFYMPDSVSRVKINSEGLRDIEHNQSKKKIIQFYGDSFTWGYGVDEIDRFTNVFSQELEKKIPNTYQVMNFGTTGYGTDQEYLLLKRKGISYVPAIVIFNYNNDVHDVSLAVNYTYPKPLFIIENDNLKLTNVPVPQKANWTDRSDPPKKQKWLTYLTYIDDKILRGSRVLNFIRDKLDKLFSSRYSVAYYNKTLAVIDSLLLESKKEVEKNNGKFIIVLIPHKKQVYGHANTIEIDHLVKFGKQKNITVINLLPDLKEIIRVNGSKENLYFDYDSHFSVKGNKIVGNLICKKLIEKGVLKVEKKTLDR